MVPLLSEEHYRLLSVHKLDPMPDDLRKALCDVFENVIAWEKKHEAEIGKKADEKLDREKKLVELERRYTDVIRAHIMVNRAFGN